MRDTRKKMVSGEKIDHCSRCYYFEDLNLPSLRQESCRHYDSAEVLAGYNYDTGEMEKGPTFFDHRTIHCNLQCISCGYVYSSSHITLHEKMWNKKIEFKPDQQFEENTGKEILDTIKRKECRNIYWAGGEPMMSNVHWGVVELIEKLSHDPEYSDYLKTIGVHYNTNLTRLFWKGKHIPTMLEFQQPSIQASIDGTHETFEYCRDGANWESVSKNWDEYYAKLNKNSQFGIASVLSSPVLMDIDRWFDFFNKYDITVYNHKYICHPEQYPDFAQGFLDIRLFPDNIFDKVLEHALNRFSQSTLRRSEHSVDILKSYIKEKEMYREIFGDRNLLQAIKKNSEYRDKFNRNGKTYPELLQIINQEAYEWYMTI